jgi:hypothetical protein
MAYNTYEGEPYYWEYVLYIGLLPLALAVVGATRRKGWVWAGLAAVALALALAQGNPLYQILRFVPGFSDFRVPARCIFLFTFAAAILAGYGWQTLASCRPIAQGRRLAFVTGLVALVTVADLFVFDRTLAPLADPQVFTSTPRIVSALKEDTTWGRSLIVTPIPIYADWSPQQGWAGDPNGWLEARVYLPADVPQSFDLPIVGGYAGFIDPRHAQFFDEAARRASRDNDLSLYSLVGTRHLVMPAGTTVDGLPSADVPPFRVSLDRDAFPRAFVVGEASGGDRDALGATLALAEARKLRTSAVVTGDLSTSDLTPLPLERLRRGGDKGMGGNEGKRRVRLRSAAAARPEIISVGEKRPERILVRARSDGAALVVLNERWDPGWRALVDGKPAPLYETDCVLMGARIRDGEHTVEFLYQPRGLIIGRVVSLASLALCLVILGASLKRRSSGS